MDSRLEHFFSGRNITDINADLEISDIEFEEFSSEYTNKQALTLINEYWNTHGTVFKITDMREEYEFRSYEDVIVKEIGLYEKKEYFHGEPIKKSYLFKEALPGIQNKVVNTAKPDITYCEILDQYASYEERGEERSLTARQLSGDFSSLEGTSQSNCCYLISDELFANGSTGNFNPLHQFNSTFCIMRWRIYGKCERWRHNLYI